MSARVASVAPQSVAQPAPAADTPVKVALPVPEKYYERLRLFIKENQAANMPPGLEKVRVSNKKSVKDTVYFSGPWSSVEWLSPMCQEFIAQEKQDEKDRRFTLEFEFPRKFANILVGRGGSKIRELRDKFDVDIQVDNGTVTVTGYRAKAEAAKAHITALAKQLQEETRHVLKIDPKYHGELIGAQGSQICRLQDRYKVLIYFPRTAKNAGGDDAKSVSESSSSDSGKSSRRQQAADEVVVRGDKQGADEARDELLSLLHYLQENSFTATVAVQARQLPSLIGSKGMALDQLRQSTGAKIDIPSAKKSDDPQARVEVLIRGTKAEVDAAKKMLEEKRAVFEDTVTRTIEVDKKYHKALIGAGGSNLRELVIKAGGSDDYRDVARTIRFPGPGSDDKTVRVEGRTEVVDKIVAQIEAFVAARESRATAVVDVPVDRHRTLIGRGGETKRKLEAQFGVALDVPRQGSGKTAVGISGPSEAAVEEARAHIESAFVAAE